MVGLPNDCYQAVPGAFEELLQRVRHDGEISPSWRAATPPADPLAAVRRAAHHELQITLREAGYRSDPEQAQRRLRLVK